MEFLMNMTVAVSVTTVLILLIKYVFKDKLTPKWHTLIWLILLVRVLLPTLPESTVSVFNFIPDIQGAYADYLEGRAASSAIGENQAGLENLGGEGEGKDSQGGAIIQDTNRGAEAARHKDFKSWLLKGEHGGTVGNGGFAETAEGILLVVYWSGALLMGASLLFSYGKLRRRAKNFRPCVGGSIANIFEECKEVAGVSGHKIALRQGADTPMLMGVFNPTVYISQKYDEEELRYVFIHELCHYKNFDILWNVLSSAILCLNWFNPIAWYGFKKFRRDLEMYCDYRTVNIAGNKKAYAEVLLKTATGKNSFVFATTSLENGEKEVSKRIKRIAYFKQPKVWVSCVGVILAVALGIFCLTDPIEELQKYQVIAVNGPSNQWKSHMMKVPLSWGEGYEKIEPQDAQGTDETIRFTDKSGNETVVLTYREIDLGEKQKKRVNPVTGAEAIIGEGEVDYEGEIAASPEVAEITDRLTDSAEIYFTYEPLTTSSEAIYKTFMMKYFSKVEEGSEEDRSDGEINGKALIRKEIYIVADEYSQVLPVLYTENSSITEAEMMQAVNSFEKIDEPMLYRPKGTAEMYVDNENGVGIQGGAYDAKALFTDYLDNYVDTIMPQEMDIKSYKIHSMEEAVPVGDVAGIIDEGMIEGETAPWDIIYPTAKVYKIDYELIPAKPDKFHDVAGGGFDITKEGNKRYRESYGVFNSYSLDGKTYEAVFLGFLHPASMGEWGVDYSVLRTINDWYDYEVFPKVLEKAKVKYVGNASEVGRLIGLLPLSEYSDGIALQTTKEPYNVTVNYKIGTEDIHDSQVGGVLSPLPKADGNQKRIHSSVEGQENYMNRYIAAQAMENNKKLMAAIDNLGSATVAASSPYVKEEVSLTLRRDDWK